MGRKQRIDMTGQRYGRLIGIGFDHRSRSGHAHWLFRCDCGGEVVACGHNVRSGSTSSCGCLHRELSAARLTEHGFRAAKRHDPTYRAWQSMRGEAAIVCEQWNDFAAFAAAMGERPPGTKLARANDADPYEAGNCAWVPLKPRAARAIRGWDTRRRGDIGLRPSGGQVRVTSSQL